MLSRYSPDPPDRRTSEEAHLRRCGSICADCNRRASGDGERGVCPERRDAATGIVVLGDPERSWSIPDCIRPAARRLGSDTDVADDPCDQVHLQPARLEGGQVLDRLPELRRRDGPGRQVGLGQVLVERERLRTEQQRGRRDRNVQLGLCRDHRSGSQPCRERSGRDGQPGEHVRRPDARRPGHGGR